MTVQIFVKIVWTVFEKFEFFMKRSGEKKQHDCICSRKFFPTPKKLNLQDLSVCQTSKLTNVHKSTNSGNIIGCNDLGHSTIIKSRSAIKSQRNNGKIVIRASK